MQPDVFKSAVFNFALFALFSLTSCAPDSPFASDPKPVSPSSNKASLEAVRSATKSIASQTPALVSGDSSDTDASGGAAADRAVRKISATDLYLYPVFQALGQSGEMNTLVVSRDGKKAYIGGSDGSVIYASLFKPDEKNNQAGPGRVLYARLLFRSTRPIEALALSGDESYLAIAQYSSVSLVNLATGAIEHEMTQVGGRIMSLAWDPRGELLLMGRASGEIFGWRLSGTPDAGRDSRKALEHYGIPGGTPIVRLVFHPSSRAFISASRDGDVILWRLLRTETELGLRDETAVIDEDRKGSKNVLIARTGVAIEDLWLDNRAQEVFVSGVNGRIGHWKLRGIEAGKELEVGADAVGSIQGIDLKRRSGNEAHFLIAAGRGQNVKTFCRETMDPGVGAENPGSVPVEVSKKDDGENSDENVTRIVDGRLIVAQAAPKPPGPPDYSRSVPAKVMAQSVTLREPISQLRSGSAILWGTQKKGNLLIFDARPVLSAIADNCG